MHDIMNVSGKFLMPTSHATSDSVADNAVKETPVIPPTPTPPTSEKFVIPAGGESTDYMAIIKEYFGKLWWLWLVVVFLWLTKED